MRAVMCLCVTRLIDRPLASCALKCHESVREKGEKNVCLFFVCAVCELLDKASNALDSRVQESARAW